MPNTRKLWMLPGLLLTLLALLAACASPPPEVQVVEVTATPEPATEATDAPTDAPEPTDATDEPTDAPEPTDADAPADASDSDSEPVSGSFTTPHPILGDLRVRQAIAFCTDRPELIQSVYPFLSAEEQEALLMDSFLPRGHWAEAPQEMLTLYDFDPEQGQALLDEAGWTDQGSGEPRTNAEGSPLALKFLSTEAQFRQTWAAVLEQQLLENCGIQLIRTHAPGSFVFGDTSGLQRRDFELGAFAWVGSADPKGATLYACNQIPLPENNWEGQNYMGWCNDEASRAIIAANSTLEREARIEQYGIVQREFTADMVSLPLFNRLSAAAATPNLLNYRPNATEYHLANVYEWELADGGDTVIIGVTQEPESFFTVANTQATARMLSSLISAVGVTTYDYDYQPLDLVDLPTLDNGGATLEDVTVEPGALIWSVDGEPTELAPGVEYLDINGETIAFAGDSATIPQLTVTFVYTDGITWEDGEPLKQADFELAYAIRCDTTSGAASYRWCESIENVEFIDDTSYTITYRPGALWPEYSAYTMSFYPSHQELADGRVLADVPAAEWATLTEVAETPLSNGPYRIVEWEKGQRMVFEANPFYHRGPLPVQTIVASFISDENQIVAQLLSGTIDVLGTLELSAGPQLAQVLEAAEGGDLQAFSVPNPTWEHIDMNLAVR